MPCPGFYKWWAEKRQRWWYLCCWLHCHCGELISTLPLLCICLPGIQAGPAHPAGLGGTGGLQGCCNHGMSRIQECVCPAVDTQLPGDCPKWGVSTEWPYHDELLCFSAGAITTDFCAVEETLRLTVWGLSAQAGAWSGYTGNSALLEAVWLHQLCLNCCGQQLGPGSPWSLDCAADRLHGEGYPTVWDTAKGIFQAWHRSHQLLALLAVCGLLVGQSHHRDFWQWHSQVSAGCVTWPGKESRLSLQDVWSQPQREVCVVPTSSRTLGETLVAVLLSHRVCLCWEGWKDVHRMDFPCWLSQVLPWETTRVSAHPQPSRIDCGYREWSEGDCFLEQTQLKFWANVSFQ